MPELPEVETMRRGIVPIVGSQIVAVERCKLRARPIQITPAGARFDGRLIGRRVTAIDRLGKRVIVRLDDETSVVFEPRMTGLVLLADPPTREHLRLRIHLENGRKTRHELMYWDQRGLGLVRAVDPAELEKLFGPERLGPDALAITVEGLREQFVKSRRPIKVALLDQRAVAGIGNLYASEMLHLAAIHPARPCHRLRAEDWQLLHTCMRRVLETAIRYEGSTLSDGTYRNALNEQGSYQNHHRVYDRAGKPCRTCRGEIVRIVQAQRSTFFCPTCQPKTARRK
ncbi:MAG TPA: bifunctional DNA-formamidopyrimidine glycosylase/DNA-(apurinic or apyrimidinic site) lyase [Pirellulales bacterium]|jgi:formamidopyrimidine-DNA glycosylase